jgi:hypothetical protein
VFEPFSSHEESVTTVRRYSTFNCEIFDPRFSIVFSKEVTHRVISANETEISVKRVIFSEIGVVPFIDRSVEFESFVDLFEEGGFAEVIIGT